VSRHLLQLTGLAHKHPAQALNADHLASKHHAHVLVVPDGSAYDFFVVCSCGWVSSPLLDTLDATQTFCEVETAQRQAAARWRRYGEALHTAESTRQVFLTKGHSDAKG
jgi:uncharacterized protein YcsI (UPF0317 family)